MTAPAREPGVGAATEIVVAVPHPPDSDPLLPWRY